MPWIPWNWDDPDPRFTWDNPNLHWDLGLWVEDTMAEPIQIALGLRSLSEADYITRLTTIHTNMAKPENAALVTGAPFTAAQLATAVGDFAAKVQAGKDNVTAQKANTQQKKEKKAVSDDIASRLAGFFEVKVGVSASQVTGLGFPLKAASAPPDIAAPADLSITFGDVSGSVSAHWQPLADRVTYLLQYRLANTPGAAWVTGYTNTSSDCRVTGLTPGALYEFQVCAIFPGVQDPGPACAVVEHRAA